MTDLTAQLKSVSDDIERFWLTRTRKGFETAMSIRSAVSFFIVAVEALHRLQCKTSLDISSDMKCAALGLVYWEKLKTIELPQVRLSKCTTAQDKAAYSVTCQTFNTLLSDEYYTKLAQSMKTKFNQLWQSMSDVAQ